MGPEQLLEALSAFLRRRLRRRSRSWTGDALGQLVADCTFRTEPYAWLVHSLAAFLGDDGPSLRDTRPHGGKNWVTQAFGVLAQSAPTRFGSAASSLTRTDSPNWISASLAGALKPLRAEPEEFNNWITASFMALGGVAMGGGHRAADLAAGSGWISDALLAAAREV
ncbi:unnamed protein product [Effrenium voratum]|nr:unnamed protein product [Effrenium voratum]